MLTSSSHALECSYYCKDRTVIEQCNYTRTVREIGPSPRNIPSILVPPQLCENRTVIEQHNYIFEIGPIPRNIPSIFVPPQ